MRWVDHGELNLTKVNLYFTVSRKKMKGCVKRANECTGGCEWLKYEERGGWKREMREEVGERGLEIKRISG